jgi:GNAT superfamily N-acetyltransferase
VATLRHYRPEDLEDLYRICLLTGASGQDATTHYSDPELLGHVYAAPYGLYEPHNVFVVEDAEGVAGYIVGTHDSRRYEQRLEADWWPALRRRYADGSGTTEADRRMIGAIHKPFLASADFVGSYPAHIHMNLLPRLRGQRIGSKLLGLWVEQARSAGVRGIHLGAGTRNTGGIAFWGKNFARLREEPGAVWFGMDLLDSPDAP